MSVACPLCGCAEAEMVTNRLRFGHQADVRRCPACGLVFVDQHSFRFPENFYETEYHQTYLTHVDPDMLDPAKHHEKMRQASRPWIDKVRDLLRGGEAVLDVGCSTGHLLVELKDRAGRLCGHELSRKEVAYCRDTLELDVSDRPLAERFEPASFDVITLMFVLEHIGDPVPFLAELKRYLRPGGKLAIVVPNIDDPLVSFYRIPPFAEFYFCIEHLYYYSPQTLGRTLAAAGLTCEAKAIQEYPITNHLNWGYRQRPAETLAARRAVPDIELASDALAGDWEILWRQVDSLYREFLMRHGFGDRVWCIAEAA